jgi:hypothetical protein
MGAATAVLDKRWGRPLLHTMLTPQVGEGEPPGTSDGAVTELRDSGSWSFDRRGNRILRPQPKRGRATNAPQNRLCVTLLTPLMFCLALVCVAERNLASSPALVHVIKHIPKGLPIT